jgi:hypothetical protein
MISELLRNRSCNLRCEREQEDARGRLVEAMHRVNPLTNLVAKQLQGETGLMPINWTTVHEQPARFIDGNKALIPINNREPFHRFSIY